MKYDLDYEGMKEMFDDLNKKRNDLTGKRVHVIGYRNLTKTYSKKANVLTFFYR